MDFVSYLSASLGYRGNLGLFAEIGLHLPLAPGLQVGADVGLYSSRGVMVGPSGTYGSAHSDIRGFFRSGYIRDHGDRKTDVLGRPVPRQRNCA